MMKRGRMERVYSESDGRCSGLAVHPQAWIIGLVVVWMTSASGPLCGQSAVWLPQGATTGNIYYSGGNVGIGTTGPRVPLDVNGPIWASGPIRITGTGYFQMDADSGYQWWNGNFTDLSGSWQVVRRKLADGSWIAPLTIHPSGNVGIGTTSPCSTGAPTGCKLSVNGAIQAKEIVVNTGWSDYVFDPQYRLRPLSEVSAFVAEHKHLPGIPSEQEVQEKGVSVGEMQAKLLAKIEELTLHMIREHERNNTLEQQNKKLQEENRQILAEIAALKARVLK